MEKTEEWYMPLILALARHRQEDLCEYETSLVYIVRSCLSKRKGKGKKGKEKNNFNEQELHSFVVIRC